MDLKIKYGDAEFSCVQANEKSYSAERRLKAKESQLQKQTLDLRRESRKVETLGSQLSDRDMQLKTAVRDNDLLRDEIEEFKRTIEAKEDLIDEKLASIRQRDEMLADQEAKATRRGEKLARELEHSRGQVRNTEARLSDKERELQSAQGAHEQLLVVQELSDQQQHQIESLKSDLEGLRASGSARADEITENNHQASLFLAEMAGLSSGEYMFSGLVGAIFQRDDVFCTRAAPGMWRILQSWDETPADAADTHSLVPRDANLQIGVVLLGEAISGKLNTKRSQVILNGLIATAGSENTQKMLIAILTELACKVIRAVREATNVPLEFSLTFWQLMELVEQRIGRAVAQDSAWRTHKASLFAELSRHPCSLVFQILRDDVRPECHDLCRLFGDSIGLCSHKDWKSVVIFDIDSHTLRFVEKTLVSRPGMLTLRIGPELGDGAVDLQLPPSDNTWLMLNL